MSARFRAGERVRVRLGNPAGHTRVPGYVRGRRGTIDAVQGSWPLPDHTAHGVDPPARPPVYTVRFDARDLWGPDGPDDLVVSVDLWEPYLMEEAGDG